MDRAITGTRFGNGIFKKVSGVTILDQMRSTKIRKYLNVGPPLRELPPLLRMRDPNYDGLVMSPECRKLAHRVMLTTTTDELSEVERDREPTIHLEFLPHERERERGERFAMMMTPLDKDDDVVIKIK
ncbi:unnamed protein product [Clavelina lepadiformis]|uniref:Uncharacterized protein n=1 Tax=Clavelina lepadiformis TaxID=159417 RepID=A0ABP0G993_CLALP